MNYCIYCRARLNAADDPVCTHCIKQKVHLKSDGTAFCEQCGDCMLRIILTKNDQTKCKCKSYNARRCAQYGCDTWTVSKNERLWWCRNHSKHDVILNPYWRKPARHHHTHAMHVVRMAFEWPGRSLLAPTTQQTRACHGAILQSAVWPSVPHEFRAQLPPFKRDKASQMRLRVHIKYLFIQ